MDLERFEDRFEREDLRRDRRAAACRASKRDRLVRRAAAKNANVEVALVDARLVWFWNPGGVF